MQKTVSMGVQFVDGVGDTVIVCSIDRSLDCLFDPPINLHSQHSSQNRSSSSHRTSIENRRTIRTNAASLATRSIQDVPGNRSALQEQT